MSKQGFSGATTGRAAVGIALVGALWPAGGARAQLRTLPLGTATDAWSGPLSAQSQLSADPRTDSVVFIHRQNINVFGGGSQQSGMLRLDISGDGGRSFDLDAGPLNFVYAAPARLPNVALMPGRGEGNPGDRRALWLAGTVDPAGAPRGAVIGFAVPGPGLPVTSEDYFAEGADMGPPTGLTPGAPGDFWFAQTSTVAADGGRRWFLTRARFDVGTDTVAPEAPRELPLTHARPGEARTFLHSPNVAFAPDGQVGWAVVLGDLEGGPATTTAIFSRTADGGATWSAPREVGLAAASYEGAAQTIAEVLGEGVVPSTTDEADLVVDADGAPHLLVAIAGRGNVSTPYVRGQALHLDREAGLVLCDLSSADGGASYTLREVSRLSTFLGFAGSSGTPGGEYEQGNSPQAARSADGRHVFFSWADTDASLALEDNLAPDLRIAALRVADGALAGPIDVTHGDPVWDGAALAPAAAPVALERPGGWHLPIALMRLAQNDPGFQTEYFYLPDLVVPDTVFPGPPAPSPDAGPGGPDADPPSPPSMPMPTSDASTPSVGLDASTTAPPSTPGGADAGPYCHVEPRSGGAVEIVCPDGSRATLKPSDGGCATAPGAPRGAPVALAAAVAALALARRRRHRNVA